MNKKTILEWFLAEIKQESCVRKGQLEWKTKMKEDK